MRWSVSRPAYLYTRDNALRSLSPPALPPRLDPHSLSLSHHEFVPCIFHAPTCPVSIFIPLFKDPFVPSTHRSPRITDEDKRIFKSAFAFRFDFFFPSSFFFPPLFLPYTPPFINYYPRRIKEPRISYANGVRERSCEAIL